MGQIYLHTVSSKHFNSDKGCPFGNKCAYNHTESVKYKESTNGLDKKVEVLETIVIEMAKKLVKLETLKMVKPKLKLQKKINLLLKQLMKRKKIS